MDPPLQKASMGESMVFHGVDRELYSVLVKDLRREPMECLQIMGLWLWLERLGTSQVIRKVRGMPPTIIDILADEAITCLKLLNKGALTSFDDDNAPFTNNILKKTVSVQIFINYQDIVLKEIHDLVMKVFIPVLADIAEEVLERSTHSLRTNSGLVSSGSASSSSSSSNPPRAPSPTYYTNPFSLNFSALSIKGDASSSSSSSPSNPPRSSAPLSYANPFDISPPSLSIMGDANVPPLCNRALPAYINPRAPNFSGVSIPGVVNAAPHPQNRAQMINRPEYSRRVVPLQPVVPLQQANIPEYVERVLAPQVPPRQANRQEIAERALAPHQADVPEHTRTMFATFSKGYPVSETEIKQFFTALLGDCIQGLHMQEVEEEEQQPLYARIVFANQSFIQAILNGYTKAKYSINGKHVWIRRFVPRNARPAAREAQWVPPRLRDRNPNPNPNLQH